MQLARPAIVASWLLLAAVAQESPQATVEQLTKLFHKIDKDGDNKVPAAEFQAFAKEMRFHFAHQTLQKRTDPDAKTYFQDLDTDKDGKVSLAESTALFEGDSEDSKVWARHDRAKFKAADKNSDGFLDAKEFVTWEWPEIDAVVEEAFARSIFEHKDADKDGFLEFREFYNYLQETELAGNDYYEESFKKYDKSGDGKLDLSETLAVESGRHEVEEAMEWVAEHADADRDGEVTLEELLNAQPAVFQKSAGYHFQDWVHALEL